jgi:Cu/Zn superoxide dismutase
MTMIMVVITTTMMVTTMTTTTTTTMTMMMTMTMTMTMTTRTTTTTTTTTTTAATTNVMRTRSSSPLLVRFSSECTRNVVAAAHVHGRDHESRLRAHLPQGGPSAVGTGEFAIFGPKIVGASTKAVFQQWWPSTQRSSRMPA